MKTRITFVDCEVSEKDKKVKDYGAINEEGFKFHNASSMLFRPFIKGTDFICGHNFVDHDMKYLKGVLSRFNCPQIIDTLYLSPLLEPSKRHHNLPKDEKLLEDELNNPLNDAIKCKDRFYEELSIWSELDDKLKNIFCYILYPDPHFKGFFDFCNFKPLKLVNKEYIKDFFTGKICKNSDIDFFLKNNPLELAYALAIIHSSYDSEDDTDNSNNNKSNYHLLIPEWLTFKFPYIQDIIHHLRNENCEDDECSYCKSKCDIKSGLKRFFGFDSFRTYNGEPLQENAAKAAMKNESLLAIFPTGGGKSLTFQLPALMQGEAEGGLTVVISPLLSLMKDQVDNLNNKGIYASETINGLLSPVERSEAIKRVQNGSVYLLYLAPEQLRSKTITRILEERNVVRFVIDEAHCFSSWGQDFRVDYQNIGNFIKNYQENKNLSKPIPVSCFTATAKPKVISDIQDYFRNKLNIELNKYASSADRTNLKYTVLHVDDENQKYSMLRSLIEHHDCPTIVYCSRTKATEELALKLSEDGFSAKPFHGKMDNNLKVENQEAFINNKVKIIVATSAFGMGVDKKDVKLVIHYDISDSLENYVQEAGRAGRDENIEAECYVLFKDDDLNKHFLLLNQSKLSMNEIQQVWRAVKNLTKKRKTVYCSPLEIARHAGWDDSKHDIETRVKTAIAALETSGYLERGNDSPRVYASSILVRSFDEASKLLDSNASLTLEEKENSLNILKCLMNQRSLEKKENAESRIDYLADILGIQRKQVVDSITLLKELKILANDQDMSCFINDSDTQNKTLKVLERFEILEAYLLNKLPEEGYEYDLKFLNDQALKDGINSTIKDLKTIHYFWNVKGYTQKGSIKKNSVNKDQNDEKTNNTNNTDDTDNINKEINSYLKDGNDVNVDEKVEVVVEAVPELEEQEELLNSEPSMKLNDVIPLYPVSVLKDKFQNRIEICKFIIKELYSMADDNVKRSNGTIPVNFSLLGLHEKYNKFNKEENSDFKEIPLSEVEDALLYLNKTGSLSLEGGFLVIYNTMQIKRLVLDNKIQYKNEDYKSLNEFYKHKVQQIHIVGEYANLMTKDYQQALEYVHNYFNMDFKKFIQLYFKGDRRVEINRTVTPEKYDALFGSLSPKQREIIDDNFSKHIVVAAGPGSGKTRVLVHKLASLLLMEDVKPEQLLMLTFSRAAASVFKKRLIDLIGSAAYFLEVKTFHSYCFDLLGRYGTIDDSDNVIKEATNMILGTDGFNEVGVETLKITKTVLVIDEAQDMDEEEFNLVKALIAKNDDMRVIAVGDDDQNIYGFRKADSKYMKSLISNYGAKKYEMTENYRSKANIVSFANQFVKTIRNRMKFKSIVAVKRSSSRFENGEVQITKYKSENLEIPIVNDVLKRINENRKTCILTFTNEQAYNIVSLLNKKGISATLVQSEKEVNPYKIMEIRSFLNVVNKEEDKNNRIISDNLWEEGKNKIKSIYSRSSILPACLNLLEDFESSNNNKYKSDFTEFILDSKLEDYFISKNSKTVFVSTIHKSKGREFDDVYLLVDGKLYKGKDDDKRELYVAITRAKDNLYIHSNSELFNELPFVKQSIKVDNYNYPSSDEITLSLSHKDIKLGYSKRYKKEIFKLRPGDPLLIKDYCLLGKTEEGYKPILMFSNSFQQKYDSSYIAKGYSPKSASIRYIVAWKDDDEKEYPIILPNITLVKNQKTRN